MQSSISSSRPAAGERARRRGADVARVEGTFIASSTPPFTISSLNHSLILAIEELHSIVPTNQTFDSRHQSPNYEARVSRDGSVLREGMTSNQFPGETQNSSLYPPQSAGLNYPWQVSCVTDSDGMPIQTLVRAVSVANQGPVAAPGGIRIVSKQQSGRPTSQALPAEKFEPLLAHAVPEPAARRHTLTTRIRLLVAVLRRAHGGD